MRTLACLLLAACCLSAADPRPETWATPITSDSLHNLHQVAPNLYRSAQPDADGMQAAETLGVKTVINLRAFHNDNSELTGTMLQKERLRVNTWHLKDEDVIRVLRLLKDPANGPFLIHCQHGADRTGTMCAMYRIVVQGWTREEAIREMTDGGFGYHAIWSNLPRYLRQVDVERIRQAVDAP